MLDERPGPTVTFCGTLHARSHPGFHDADGHLGDRFAGLEEQVTHGHGRAGQPRGQSARHRATRACRALHSVIARAARAIRAVGGPS
jgi:hypothetical protein